MNDAEALTPFEEIELVRWAEAEVHAAKVPRLYVTFHADGVAATFGPQLAVTLDDNRLVASSGSDEADPTGHPFTLATLDAAGWRVNDGMEGPTFRRWTVGTAAPVGE